MDKFMKLAIGEAQKGSVQATADLSAALSSGTARSSDADTMRSSGSMTRPVTAR